MITEPLFDAFVPDMIRTRLASGPAGPASPWVDTFPAALLLADISGFSTIAESFAQRGPRGAEDLRDLLNTFFGRIVTLVHEHDGQILDFPGDAALAVWPVVDGDASATLRLAAACALAARDVHQAGNAPGHPPLDFRTGLAFGDVWAAHVGGVRDRWHLVVAGEPLVQAARAVRIARRNEVVASPEAWKHLARDADADLSRFNHMRIRAVHGITPAVRRQVGSLSPGTDAVLRRYVPASVQRRVDAGQTEWLAEFRRLTVLFVNLGPIDCTAPEALDRLQRATMAVQTVVDRYDGSIQHMIADDTGLVVVCGWGLALHAHADDASRAARAAFEIRQLLLPTGADPSFGVSTGDVFTGLRGNVQRCDFAMIGSVVNLAARLMQAAQGTILCDTASFDAAKDRCALKPHGAVAVKGFAHPVETFQLMDVSPAASSSDIVGRARERRVLAECLDALAGEHGGTIVILEGDAGIGKSRLLKDHVDRAVSRGVRVVLVTGDAIERSAPHHAWRPLFRSLLALPDDVVDRGRRVHTLLESDARLLPFAALLNPVLGLNLEETDRSRSVTPVGRSLLTRDLLVHALKQAMGTHPIVLVLDDTQWFDSASWTLAEGIQQDIPHVMLVVATRTMPHDEEPQELRRLRTRDNAVLLKLDALSPDETHELVSQRLRCRMLDPAVKRLILEKAEGHPFFVEEIAHALQDRHLVAVEHGICRFTDATAARESTLLPDSVQMMVSSRIDQLTLEQQLTVKVASVLGRTFDLTLLHAIYPITGGDDVAIGEQDLASHVHALVARDLVRRPGERATTFEFKHAITQEVAYSLLPYAQRRQLHAAVARRYEQLHTADLAQFYPLLFDHWARAEAPDWALFYCEKAGDEAFGRYANEEAVRFFTEALSIDERIDVPASAEGDTVVSGHRVSVRKARRIRWQRRLGEAYINLGMWPDGWAQLEGVLSAMGHRLPTTKRSWARVFAEQLATQAAHRVWPSGSRYPPGDAANLLTETVRAYQRISSVSYISDRKATLFVTVLTALNLAEQLPPSAVLATLYASAGNIAALIPVRWLAKAYVRLARQVAEEVNDPGVTSRILGRTSVFRVAIGDWTACPDLETSMDLADQVGDPIQWGESAAVRARAAHLRGEFDRAVRLGSELRARAVASRAAAHEIWGLDAEAWGYLYLGRHQEALEHAKLGLSSAERGDRVSLLDLLGVVALVHLYRGELEEARESADRISRNLAESARLAHFAVLGMSAAVETYIGLAEYDGPLRAELMVEADRACLRVERYARINPPAAARASLWRGCLEWLGGHQASAHKQWRRSLSEAAHFTLPYEIARVHYEIGRRLDHGNPERERHLDRAEAGFQAFPATFELQRVNEARLLRKLPAAVW